MNPEPSSARVREKTLQSTMASDSIKTGFPFLVPFRSSLILVRLGKQPVDALPYNYEVTTLICLVFNDLPAPFGAQLRDFGSRRRIVSQQQDPPRSAHFARRPAQPQHRPGAEQAPRVDDPFLSAHGANGLRGARVWRRIGTAPKSRSLRRLFNR